MTDFAALKKKVDELAHRNWDAAVIQTRIKNLVDHGIPKKKLEPKQMKANEEQILDRVQRRAEENNFYLRNCPQSTALALMEEFGLGNMEIIKALTPFPSIGGTGRICGGISGSLIAFGLFFGSDRPPDFIKTNQAIRTSQKFIASFEDALGFINCSDIIRTFIIGRPLNPGESDAAMAEFAAEKGFEKCGLPPGTGARLAAGIIIDSIR